MRKITLFTMAMICLHVISNAQISKGSVFLGGSFNGFSYSLKEDAAPNYESKNSGFGILPQIGKAIGTNKIVGISFGYNQSTNESTFNSRKEKTTGYSAGIFYRRYYPLSTRFYLFGQGLVAWNRNKESQEINNILQRTTDYNNINFSITPGISYAASKKLHLEASLNQIASVGYSVGKSKGYNANGTVAGTSTQKSFGISGNGNGFSNITIGLRWILPSKK